MKKSLFIIGFFISFHCSAQLSIQWTYAAKKIAGDTYAIDMKARLLKPWHIYSKNMDQGGPLPTLILFDQNPSLIKLGPAKEFGKLVCKYEAVFNLTVKYYEDSVDFVQMVKLNKGGVQNISGIINFMLCNNQQCLPPTTTSFNIAIRQ